MVVDTQVHLWAAERPSRPWVPGGRDRAHSPTPLTQGFLLREMDRVRVDGALLVSPTWEGARNDVVIRAARTHPDRFAAVTRFAIDAPANARRFAGWAASPHVVATRVVFAREARTWLSDGTADWVWPVAEQTGVPVMIWAPGQYPAIGEVAKRHPSLKLTICHLGLDTAMRDAEIAPEIDHLLELSGFENVAVKATSLPSFVTEPYPFPSLQLHVRRVVDAFGADRVFWGSDLSRLSCSYADLYRFAREELTFLDDAELEKVLGKAACEWFGWTPRDTSPTPETRDADARA